MCEGNIVDGSHKMEVFDVIVERDGFRERCNCRLRVCLVSNNDDSKKLQIRTKERATGKKQLECCIVHIAQGNA